MDWKSALKIAGPSAIAAWVFVELIKSYLSTSEIFKTNDTATGLQQRPRKIAEIKADLESIESLVTDLNKRR